MNSCFRFLLSWKVVVVERHPQVIAKFPESALRTSKRTVQAEASVGESVLRDGRQRSHSDGGVAVNLVWASWQLEQKETHKYLYNSPLSAKKNSSLFKRIKLSLAQSSYENVSAGAGNKPTEQWKSMTSLSCIPSIRLTNRPIGLKPGHMAGHPSGRTRSSAVTQWSGGSWLHFNGGSFVPPCTDHCPLRASAFSSEVSDTWYAPSMY